MRCKCDGGEVLDYRSRSVPPRTIARELCVDHVVQGSVRRAGTRARISAQLLDPRGAFGSRLVEFVQRASLWRA